MNIIETIRNAKPGSMIDVRTVDGQTVSFPCEELQELLEWADVTLVKAEFERPYAAVGV